MKKDLIDTILCCILGVKDSKKEIELLIHRSDLDWTTFLLKSRKYGLTSLLYHRIKMLNVDKKIPEDILRELTEDYQYSTVRNMKLYHQLSMLLSAFNDVNIPVIVLKGSHLAENIYDNIALRPMGDIDILVRRSDLMKAGETMQNLGYSLSKGDLSEASCLVNHHLPPFQRQNCFPVEVHWTISKPKGPFNLDLDDLWQSAQKETLAGVETFVLSPEYLLLHLCMHAAYQDKLEGRLKPLLDIIATVQHYQNKIDWQVCISVAQKLKAEKCVLLMLSLGHELLGLSIPEEASQRLRSKDFDIDVELVAKRYIFKEWAPYKVGVNLVELWKAERTWKRFIYILRRVFLSPEHIAAIYSLPLSSNRIYLYYFRLKKLILAHRRNIWLVFRKDEKMLESLENKEKRLDLITWLTNAS